jgi:hypothetical protein
MSDTLRAAAQQALEAFDPTNGQPNDLWPFQVKALQSRACKALRAALAERTAEKSSAVASDTLPPLPEPDVPGIQFSRDDPDSRNRGLYTADQMRSYAAAALAAAVAEPVAHLWQHSETGRTRVVMPDQVVTTDASWLVVGPLYLAPPQREPLTDADIDAACAGIECSNVDLGVYDRLIARAIERAHGISAPASAPKEQA